MENLQDAVHIIQQNNTLTARQAADIIIKDSKVAMSGFAMCLELDEGIVIYPTSFGYICNDDIEDKIIVVARRFENWEDFPFSEMFEHLNDVAAKEEEVTVIE